jgi:hypothetical protein
MAAMRRGIVAEREAIGLPVGEPVTEAPNVAPAMADERASMNFIGWVRTREPDFFMMVPPQRGALRSSARQAYELKLAAYGRAWRPGSGEEGQVPAPEDSTP